MVSLYPVRYDILYYLLYSAQSIFKISLWLISWYTDYLGWVFVCLICTYMWVFKNFLCWGLWHIYIYGLITDLKLSNKWNAAISGKEKKTSGPKEIFFPHTEESSTVAHDQLVQYISEISLMAHSERCALGRICVWMESVTAFYTCLLDLVWLGKW